MAACSACNRKVVGSNPDGALLIPEVNVVDIQLRALFGLCSLLVHSASYAYSSEASDEYSMIQITLTVFGLVRSFGSCNLPVTL